MDAKDNRKAIAFRPTDAAYSYTEAVSKKLGVSLTAAVGLMVQAFMAEHEDPNKLVLLHKLEELD